MFQGFIQHLQDEGSRLIEAIQHGEVDSHLRRKKVVTKLIPMNNEPFGSGKRQAKVLEENYWDCSVCTYRNTAEAFKCLMCDVRKGTSTRKPRINPQLVAQQVAQQQYVPLLKPGKKEGGSGSSTASTGSGSKDRNKPRRKSRHPPRLKNIDRSTAQSNEVTVNNVTVVITEYKPKVKKASSDQSGLSSSASSENGSQHDSNQDSRSLDIGTDA